ncbi:hypothetical protein AX14_013096 [Amanita brunnescens Koide BX004]|nr:hypothetical protein AX14_013096 [Amanita brunnescens Koide BX004]
MNVTPTKKAPPEMVEAIGAGKQRVERCEGWPPPSTISASVGIPARAPMISRNASAAFPHRNGRLPLQTQRSPSHHLGPRSRIICSGHTAQGLATRHRVTSGQDSSDMR